MIKRVLGITKKIAETYVEFKLNKKINQQWAILRFGNVWDSNGSLIPLWKQQLKQKAVIEV